MAFLSTLAAHLLVARTHAVRAPAMASRTMVGQAVASTGRVRRLVRNVWIGLREDVAGRLAEGEAARRAAETWRLQAEASDRRIEELERTLASHEVTSMQLRSRLVCLHGKLATTAATVKYQSMTLDLGRRQH